MKMIIGVTLAAISLGSAMAQTDRPTRPPASEAHGPAALQSFMTPPDDTESALPRPNRARGVPVALAVQAAQSTLSTCEAAGSSDVTVVIVDSQGVPTIMLSAANSATIAQRMAMGKAYTALKTQMPSAEAMEKAKTDPAFAARMAADPLVGTLRAGGIPIKVGNDVIGAIGVSGGKSTKQVEICARTALDGIRPQLH